MKKTPPLLLLFSIMVIGLTQSCSCKKNNVGPDIFTRSNDSVNDLKKPIYEPKDTVAIYLTSVKRKDGNGKYSYHLAMFDANGNWGIDTLVTGIKHPTGKSRKIQWIKVIGSGIKEIAEIKCTESEPPKIFKNIVQKQNNGVWNLTLPDTIEIPKDRPYIKEKYLIKYIPEGSNDTITIDPYLRVPPE
jgi:hypothetical protein